MDKIIIDEVGDKIKLNSEWTNDAQRILEYMVKMDKIVKVTTERKIYYTKK